jgi:hypothetical protein
MASGPAVKDLDLVSAIPPYPHGRVAR